MRKTEILAISVDPGLKKQMLRLAKMEHRTISELLRECFRRYHTKKELHELVAKGIKRSKALGIKEKDVEAIIDELRK